MQWMESYWFAKKYKINPPPHDTQKKNNVAKNIIRIWFIFLAIHEIQMEKTKRLYANYARYQLQVSHEISFYTLFC